MNVCKLYLNMSITPIIFSPAPFLIKDGIYRKVPCSNQWIIFNPFYKDYTNEKVVPVTAELSRPKKEYRKKRRTYFMEKQQLELVKKKALHQEKAKYVKKKRHYKPFKDNQIQHLPPENMDTHKQTMKQQKKIPLIEDSTITQEATNLNQQRKIEQKEYQTKLSLEEGFNERLMPNEQNDTLINTDYKTEHLAIKNALSFGDRITVYDKCEKIDTGRLLWLSNEFFVWTDSEGYSRFQLIEGPITIKKH